MKIDCRKRRTKFFAVLVMLALTVACAGPEPERNPPAEPKPVLPGIEVLLSDYLNLLDGKRVGLITNPTGVTRNLVSTIDTLYNQAGVNLVALFGPEHGVRGDADAGALVSNSLDRRTGLPVFSLYGRTKKPTPDVLKNIDLLLFDIQDIGSRAYTYLYTLAYAMEAAAENDIPFMVLDRPNPLGGELAEGPVLEKQHSSFIGLYPIPYIYGMTIGELAQLFNEEFEINCDLTVIPLKNWRRSMTFSETGLTWVPTSPHVPHEDTPFFIAATGCIGELQVVNEGVGYTLPFELVGAPGLDGRKMADILNSRNIPGIRFRPLSYKPFYGKFTGQYLSGVQMHIVDHSRFRPMLTQLHILEALLHILGPEQLFRPERLDVFTKAVGTDSVRQKLVNGESAEQIYASFAPELNRFRTIREKYLIYKN